ncbi:MAG: hypothetical protein AUJ52_06545 [Elusimicrobia bacterium CG1_02_63_36]|nr:MAG: hypothetical protein AUJ52_06545 [Elusimicrobia bacterium CG1_02_63_36]PIP84038.1 MAG: hypothetical protein COR54_06225 [Elusimicrobia bacterium CG22_combo_CG10-13_8_21_14_all_63_91]PJA12715.1 MAG: hypothetical protein COX66_16740 [Elusimicrobia bacterium CG_4_10_14_0_2_um_filter_63_34]PJB24014.1 MAG: hypothetical protein CO113_16060 [Elusimicrobia bacterium CG_4_9_14_3_um_filter_62_55]
MKNMLLAAAAVLLVSPSIAGAQCVRGSEKGLRVGWTAFKTPAKIGVGGHLRGMKSQGPSEAQSWQRLVLGQTLTLDADEKSVDTDDKARDAKIAKFFFDNMKGKIVARVVKIDEKEKTLTLSVTMNGRTVDNVAMEFKREGDGLKARGHIDVLDFGASKALKAINEACFEKHQGKTWSHVEIRFDADFKPCL